MKRLLVLLAACQPGSDREPVAPCDAEPPDDGEVRIVVIDCSDMSIPDGEGRQGDTWMANSRFRAVLRHPQDALTAVGVGGGTLVDAAPWDLRDRLHEAIPLVDGGWLDVEASWVDGNRVVLGGTVRALPDGPATEGGWREVAWRIEPDESALHLDDADGLYIHAAGAQSLIDGALAHTALVYGTDAEEIVDLGGAIRALGARRLVVASRAEAWAELARSPQRVAGRAPGADNVVAYADGRRVAWIPVVDDVFATWIDGSADALVADAFSRTPSPPVPPGGDVDLELGPLGAIGVLVSWDGARPRRVRVDWRSRDGRGGRAVLPAEGGVLPVGAGAYTLTVQAGPSVWPREAEIDVAPGQTAWVNARLDAAYDPGPRVLAALGWASDISRTWRGTDWSAAQDATGAGFDYVVFTPEDEIAGTDDNQIGHPLTVARNGALARARDGSWTVWSWPWRREAGSNGHGMVDIAGMGPVQALAALWGGGGKDRHTVVDTPWLLAVGLPHQVDPWPGFVRLPDPGDAGPDHPGWQAWFAWLQGGALLVPVGPFTWVEVDDPGRIAAVDVERGLIPGRVAATTGPLVSLQVKGAGPGDLRPRRSHLHGRSTQIRLTGREPLDHLALIVDGEIVARWRPNAADFQRHWPHRLDGDWAVAVAWSDTGGGWAASGPVWLSPPVSRPGVP